VPGSLVGEASTVPETSSRNLPDRRALLESALRLSFFTIGWNGVVGAASLGAALAADSLALAGFALNALLDSSASAVLVWRFRKERDDPAAAEHLERRAQTCIVVAMLAIALYIGAQAVRALAGGSHPESSRLGFALAVLSLAVLPWLAWRKFRVGSELGSPALRGDGVLALAAAALAAITLAALLVNAAFDWWWADPLAALVIACALGLEAVRVTVRHRFG
jgi:divalent metal cation (Fe/Co/Zn/Cd) transporter